MTATNVDVSGKIKFFNQEKGFGIIVTKLGDVFIHVTKTGGKQDELVPDAEVRIDFTSAFKDGEVKHAATALLSVKAPPAPIEVLDKVKFYNKDKNFGFIFCAGHGFSKGEAILRGKVVNEAKPWKIDPDKGMAVRAMVIQKSKGPEVVSYEWGPEVDAAYAAKLKGQKAAKAKVEAAPEVASSEAKVEKPEPKKKQRRVAKKSAAKPSTPKKPAAKKAAPKKVSAKKPAPKKKPAAKKATTTPTDVAAAVAECASSGNGSMALALQKAIGETAH